MSKLSHAIPLHRFSSEEICGTGHLLSHESIPEARFGGIEKRIPRCKVEILAGAGPLERGLEILARRMKDPEYL
jgi:hypothetical protein